MRTIKNIGVIVAVLGLLTAMIALITEGIKLYRELPTPTPILPTTISPTETLEETPPTQIITSSSQKLSLSDYGKLLYEDNFDNDTGVWSFEKGSQIQNGMFILASNAATRPKWSVEYTDFIFETEFQFINPPQSGWTAMSAYLKYANPPCTGFTGNCSNQVAVSSEGIVAVWRPNGTNNYEQLLAETKVSQFSSNGIHKLTVIINGSEFRIFLDDVFIRSFNDSTYTSGIVVLGADDTPIAFNYVRIYAIP